MRWLQRKCNEHNHKYDPYLRYFRWTPQTWLHSLFSSVVVTSLLIVMGVIIKSVGGVLIGIIGLVLLVGWHFWDLLH